MFGWEFPPHNSGGLGTACLGITKSLSKKKTKVTFVLPKKIEGAESFLRIVSPETPYISFYSVDSPLSPYLDGKKYESYSTKGDSVYGRSLYEEVSRYSDFGWYIAGKEDFDVIHAHEWLSFGAGIKAKERSGKPFIAHIHATEFDRTGGEGINPRVYAIEKRGMEMADRVVAVSNLTKSIVVKHYGIPEEKVEVVHNGVEFEEEEGEFREVSKMKEHGKKMVLFVGRITLQKGPDYFIRAAKRVCEVCRDTFFVISGSGDMQCQMMEQVAREGLSDRVFFTGFMRGEKLRSLYRSADLFVMPSVSEPFGITPLESLINGTPVLISKQSGSSEVLMHALKVDFWDIDDMANKMICALNYDSLNRCLKENGRREVFSINWDKTADKLIKIYNNL